MSLGAWLHHSNKFYIRESFVPEQDVKLKEDKKQWIKVIWKTYCNCRIFTTYIAEEHSIQIHVIIFEFFCGSFFC